MYVFITAVPISKLFARGSAHRALVKNKKIK
jgi:hypothetical protein